MKISFLVAFFLFSKFSFVSFIFSVRTGSGNSKEISSGSIFGRFIPSFWRIFVWLGTYWSIVLVRLRLGWNICSISGGVDIRKINNILKERTILNIILYLIPYFFASISKISSSPFRLISALIANGPIFEKK